MNTSETPVVKDIVLVGGGHSHVAVLKRFGMKPVPGIRLTLICRDVHTPYSGMLPGYVAGHYDYDDAHIDLGALARFAGARFYHNAVTGLDLLNNKVHCDGRPDIPYELLSINIGSAPQTDNVPGASDSVTPVKPISQFLSKWEALRTRALTQDGPMRVAVVGGGAGGVEILLALQFRLKRLRAEAGMRGPDIEYHLFTDTPDILPTHGDKVRATFRDVLEKRGVTLHTGHAVTEVSKGRLIAANGAETEADEILWVTAAGAASWLAQTGLDLDEQGFIAVSDTLQSTSHPNVFAAGDIASVINHPRPKSGVFAVRQGPPLADNIRRLALGQTPKPFKPQKEFLGLISTGDKYAVASRGSWSIKGRLVWMWKDWIDRRFMKKFNDLPDMAEETKTKLPRGLADNDVIKEISAIAMRCADAAPRSARRCWPGR
jgi:selenide,water dikinase